MNDPEIIYFNVGWTIVGTTTRTWRRLQIYKDFFASYAEKLYHVVLLLSFFFILYSVILTKLLTLDRNVL